MLHVEHITPQSPAERAGLLAGDQLVSINGRQLVDILDYHLAIDTVPLQLDVLRNGRESLQLVLEHELGVDPGIHLQHPDPEQCGNNCLFCFVHQLPPGLRRSLYVKDEDYRFSYLYGSYVTLSNIDQVALRRIIDDQLSPLYISVHATDDNLRAQLLGRRTAPIVELLEELTGAGIEVHCQVVICPGINDGSVLQQTIEALYRLAPGVRSLAIVPVGLTRFRKNLPVLRSLTLAEAQDLVAMVTDCQRRFFAHGGSRFVFAADELYLQADLDFPALETYEELWQLENGVGMVPRFRDEAEEVLAEAQPLELGRVTTLTGDSFAVELTRFVRQLQNVTGVSIDVRPIRNRFFGEQVTVAGLLTGQDLLQQLDGLDLGEALLIPDVMLKDNEDLFLDDLSLADLEERLQVPVEKIASSPWGLLDALERLAHGAPEVILCSDSEN